MSDFSFKILSEDKNSNARTGVIHTAHGDIQTPAFVPVGTQATVKSLSNQELQEVGISVFFINTYHLCLRPGLEVIKGFGGLHKFTGWSGPLMTDSAGFQIFSLGDVNRRRRLCLQVFDLLESERPRSRRPESSDRRGDPLEIPLVKISDEGVTFRSHLDGSEHFFTPEKSIEAQKILGSDIMIAFDECAYYPATYEYTRSAMERTHRWALRCLAAAQGKLQGNHQALYGVIQGGVYEDLRKESAKFISNLPFEGIAIGGVAVGESKEEMKKVLDWVTPCLPEDKPRHLLGVGEIDDIFEIVEMGIDSFDCVMPTRLARMGHLLVQSAKCKAPYRLVQGKVQSFTIDITKSEFAKDKRPIDETCECFVCKNYHRAYLNHLFRAKELLAYRLATYHNLFFVEKLVKEIRTSIKKGTFLELKKQWLAK